MIIIYSEVNASTASVRSPTVIFFPTACRKRGRTLLWELLLLRELPT